jgi:hypothetical protein
MIHCRKALAILRQLRIGMTEAIGWIGDGSAAKVAWGMLQSVVASRNGIALSIITTTGTRRINWRIPAALATIVLAVFPRI